MTKTHKFKFEAELKNDGQGYNIEITNEIQGIFTGHDLALMVVNLRQCFGEQLLIVLKDTVEKAKPYSPN